MAKNITIKNTTISFPTDAQSPNWASGIVAFADAVADALTSIVLGDDVVPQVLNIDSYDAVSSQNVTNLQFSTNTVRSAFIKYYVYRTSSLGTKYVESGNLLVNYNGTTWEISRDYIGNANITFTITSAGQVQFTTTTISGNTHVGSIGFKAEALLQS